MALNIDESLVTTELTPALRERIITDFKQLITDYPKTIKGNRKFAAMINAIDGSRYTSDRRGACSFAAT